MRGAFTSKALLVEDTDWYLAIIYDFAKSLGASLIVPWFSRYVIDLNRPPDGAAMYPDANNTSLCPATNCEPDAAQIQARREQYWQPYHDALNAELMRIKAAHGHAVLFDGHSIASELPWLFEGKLPDLNIGTVNGTSCDAGLRHRLAQVLNAYSQFTSVLDPARQRRLSRLLETLFASLLTWRPEESFKDAGVRMV